MGFFATLNRTASDVIDCHYFYVGAEVEQLMSLSQVDPIYLFSQDRRKIFKVCYLCNKICNFTCQGQEFPESNATLRFVDREENNRNIRLFRKFSFSQKDLNKIFLCELFINVKYARTV